MSKSVLLVSETKIKAFTEVNTNLDSSLLLSNIQIAQDIGLQTILGTRFYEHILEAASGNTLSNQENILLQDYIQPYLIWRATYEALPTFYMRIMNKSIIIGNTEQGTPVDYKSFEYLRNLYMNRYEFYSQRLMDYIKNNQAAFPLYYQFTSTDGMRPSRENYYSGLHISPGFRKLPPTGIRGYLDPSSDYCCNDADY
jgi:hypothetical protein